MSEAVVALIISIIALVVTIVFEIIAHYRDFYIASAELESNYFNTIFSELLVNKIPRCREELHFNAKGMLEGIEGLCDTLNEFRNNSLYFYYADKCFYDDISKQSQDIENYLYETSNLSGLNSHMQSDFYQNLNTKISNLYKCLTDHYLPAMRITRRKKISSHESFHTTKL